MAEMAGLQATIYGRVQGVYFRDFTRKHAVELGLKGYVHNLPGGGVEVAVEGEKQKISYLVVYLRKGPPGAVVERVELIWNEYNGKYSSFLIKY